MANICRQRDTLSSERFPYFAAARSPRAAAVLAGSLTARAEEKRGQILRVAEATAPGDLVERQVSRRKQAPRRIQLDALDLVMHPTAHHPLEVAVQRGARYADP